MAKDVVSFYHKTYFGTSRLIVELAFSKNDNEKVGYRPWSKYSAGSSKYDQIHNNNSTNKVSEEDDNEDEKTKLIDRNDAIMKKIDKKKEEFLQVMMGGKKTKGGKMWGNDDGGVCDDEKGNAESKDDNSDASDDSSTNSGQSCNTSQNEITNSEQNDDDDKSPLTEFSSDRLFVRNLPFNTTEDEVKKVFTPFGKIVDCHLPVDDSNRNKGFAFVKFAQSKDATEAKLSLDGSSFQGRLIHVLPARPERDNNVEETSYEEAESTHKKKMEIERQKGASESSTGWSSNYIRGDAVVDNLANRFQMDKGTMLNLKDGLSSGNAAVRLALGETQVLQENREFFEKHGIQMDTLESSSSVKDSIKRSNSMILVKNLPYDTTVDELTKMFLAFGGDANILLPPSRTIALIDFKNSNDAKKTFRKLSYKRFKHVPLYLEWAPLNAKSNNNEKTISSTSLTVQEDIKHHSEEDDDSKDIQQRPTSIYIKNLNFSTSENDIRKIFEDFVGKQVKSVRIPVKVAPLKHQTKVIQQAQQLSMGYGFVECSSEEAARHALKKLQGKVINGHALELEFSSKSNSTQTNDHIALSTKKSTKLIVRNVPFQASRTDILQLFGSFGQLKTVRLPKKFDGGHRGFAFVEFSSFKEAQNAMVSLSQTHLYGRHLVLGWADEGDSNISSSKRNSIDITSNEVVRNKKIRFNYS